MIDLRLALDSFTDEQKLIAESAASFYAGDSTTRRVRAQRGKPPGYSLEAWRDMAGLGWLGLQLPEASGGSGASHSQTILLLEQLGRALAPEPLTAAALMGGGAILHGDNEDLRRLLTVRMARGEFTPALAWQEPGRGQQINPQNMVATGNDGRITLHGMKCFVPMGEGADAFVVSARTGQGTSLFLIDKDATGVSLSSQPRVDGGFFSELRLEGVAVGADRVVAGEGVAAVVLQRVLDEGRLAASAEMVGVMARAFEMSVEYIKTREQFGRPIGGFQALQHRAVDLLVQIELSRSVLLHAAAAFDESTDPVRRAAVASQVKARCSAAALKVTRECIQLHGGFGYTDEANIGLFLKKAMVLAAWLGGASEHRTRYAELVGNDADAKAHQAAPDGPMPEVRRWLEENFPPAFRYPAHRLDSTTAQPWLKKLCEKGWMAPNWPLEHGGMGLSAYEQILFHEEFDRVGMSIAPNLGAAMLGPLLIRYGSEAQKREHLPRILSGEIRWCQGYSEPGAGSDLAALRTSAVLDGDHFIVNGQKIWTSFAYEAHKVFLLVRTDQSARKQLGISFLLVDMDTPGITVKRITNLTGSAEFCEVFFDNVRVPRENLVGLLNDGWSMAKSLLGSERILLGSPRMARYPMRLLREYAQSCGQLDDPVFRAKWVELQLDVEDLGLAYVRMVNVLRRGGTLGAEVSILKIWITETFQRITDLILETCAETATVNDAVTVGERSRLHAANVYLASRAATIYGGSNEIQRNILAKAILGLPG